LIIKLIKIRFDLLFFLLLATVVTSGGPPFDFTITGSKNYRPLAYTEKVFTDEWAKKLSTNNNHPKEPIISNQKQGLYLEIKKKTTTCNLMFGSI
jgi:hypothetical protein